MQFAIHVVPEVETSSTVLVPRLLEDESSKVASLGRWGGLQEQVVTCNIKLVT